MNYLSEYCNILKPLAYSLDILQGEQNTFYGYLLPCLGSILRKFEKLESEKFVFTRPVLEAFKNGLLKRFKIFFLINLDTVEVSEAIKASFSIPKFKLKWINNFKSYSKEDQILKLIMDTIGYYMYRLFHD